MEMFSALTSNSSNKKTGPITVSTTSRHSCPACCPFLGDEGCYADAGYYTRLFWDKVTAGKAGVKPRDFIKQVKKLPANEMFRHDIAGDLWPDPAYPKQIFATYLNELAKATSHLFAAWTYTHHTLDGIDGAINKHLILTNNATTNFVINLSTESLDLAAKLQKEGFMVTVVQPEGLPTSFKHHEVPFVQCPATLPNSNVTCRTCGGRRGKPLCASIRKVVVVFPAHGSRKAKAITHCS